MELPVTMTEQLDRRSDVNPVEVRPASTGVLQTSDHHIPHSAPIHSAPSLVGDPAPQTTAYMSQQLDRQQAFRKQLADARARLESLRSEARSVELALVSSDHQVSLLQDQILGLRSYIGEAEEELFDFRREIGAHENVDLARTVEQVSQAVAEDEREVMELRAQLERIGREKSDLQSTQSTLVEKKRQAEQDRNLMITGLESDRAKLVALRADRLKMWEQRSALEKELATKTYDAVKGKTGVLPGSAASLSSPPKMYRDKKGIRADSSHQGNTTVEQALPCVNDFKKWDQFNSDPLAGAFGSAATNVPRFGVE